MDIDMHDEKDFIPRNQWDTKELSRYCQQPKQVLLLIRNAQKNIFLLRASIPNSLPICHKDITLFTE